MKRKKASEKPAKRTPAKRKKEAISSDEESVKAAPESEDEFFETTDEKRVRLAKKYLHEVGERGGDVGAHLQRDVDFESKRLEHTLADSWRIVAKAQHKGHKLSATCVCLSDDGRTAATGGKDCAVLLWDVEAGAKTVFPGGRNCVDAGGHFKEVRGVAMSPDGNTVVSIGGDRLVRIWDARCASVVSSLRGHDGAGLGVALDPDGETVYSCAADRTVKVWSLGMRAYMDTLFGHTASVNCIDIFQPNRLITGGEDKTTRLWKTQMGTHLLFSHHAAAVDSVAAIDGTKFASGGQDGTLVVAGTGSKKPLCAVERAHGGLWLAAVASARLSDVVLSGAADGVRIWGTSKAGKKLALREVDHVPVEGVVNGLAVARSGRLVVAALGQEHKHGRWARARGAKNGLLVVRAEHDGPSLLY